MVNEIEKLTGASVRVDADAGWVYTGSEFIVCKMAHLIHEFHHWWVSNESERKQTNFGLDEWDSPERTFQQEKRAIELDLALARACGIHEVVMWGLADYERDFLYRDMDPPKALPYPEPVQAELRAILIESAADRGSWDWFLENCNCGEEPGTYPPINDLDI